MAKEQGLEDDLEQWEKVDELPFDFERRRLSVLVRAQKLKDGATQGNLLLICKVRWRSVVQRSHGRSVLFVLSA